MGVIEPFVCFYLSQSWHGGWLDTASLYLTLFCVMRMRIDLEVISSVVVEFFFEKYRIILIIWYFECDDQYDLSLSMCFIDFFILKIAIIVWKHTSLAYFWSKIQQNISRVNYKPILFPITSKIWIHYDSINHFRNQHTFYFYFFWNNEGSRIAERRKGLLLQHARVRETRTWNRGSSQSFAWYEPSMTFPNLSMYLADDNKNDIDSFMYQTAGYNAIEVFRDPLAILICLSS